MEDDSFAIKDSPISGLLFYIYQANNKDCKGWNTVSGIEEFILMFVLITVPLALIFLGGDL